MEALDKEIAELDRRMEKLQTSLSEGTQSTPRRRERPRESGFVTMNTSGAGFDNHMSGYGDARTPDLTDVRARRSSMAPGARPKIRFTDEYLRSPGEDDMDDERLNLTRSPQSNRHQPFDLRDQAHLAPNVTMRRTPQTEAFNVVEKGAFMKPATYDGTGSWIDYQAHFAACANINGWSRARKGLYLAAALRGQALTVLGNLSQGGVCDYDDLVSALEARFFPANQTELYRAMLRERKLKPRR